jgi:hypothetical protein
MCVNFVASRRIAMDVCSASDIQAFRQHATVYCLLLQVCLMYTLFRGLDKQTIFGWLFHHNDIFLVTTVWITYINHTYNNGQLITSKTVV